jgi:cell fate (sporulation/competence/biofilm development) regulator YlbF (YheA/YmcA/DUF963 family)
MNELKTYLELSEQVKADNALMQMIESYETETKQLMELLQDSDYDAQEAIRLTNDIEYMSDQISKNPLYNQFVSAKNALDKVLLEKAAKAMPCDCNCSTCKAECSSREEEK